MSPPPDKPLTIVCPPGARMYLVEQQALFDIGLGPATRGTSGEIHFIDCYPIEAGKELGAFDQRFVLFLIPSMIARLTSGIDEECWMS